MRILHVVSSPARSGVTANIELLATGLKARGITPGLAHYGLDAGIAPELRRLGAPVFELAGPSFLPGLLRTLWTVALAKIAVQRFSPDLVHAHSWDADLVACRACAGTAVPVVVSIQSFSYIDWVRSHGRQYERHGAPLKRLIAVSGPLKREAEGLAPLRGKAFEMVFNAAADRFFEPVGPEERAAARERFRLAPSDKAVTCVANYHPVKGQEVLAQAFAALCRSRGDARLLIMGSASDAGGLSVRTQVESVLRGAGLWERARLIEGASDARPVLAAADVYVQPSHMEAMGLAIAEAMACGLPVVATAVGGIPDIVSQATGIIVPPADPPAMARAVGALLDSSALRAELGNAGRSVASARLSAAASLDAHERVYRSCLSNGRAAG